MTRFETLTDGRIRFEVPKPASSAVLDPTTEGWLDVIEAAAENGGCHVLYRLRANEPDESPTFLQTIASRLVSRQENRRKEVSGNLTLAYPVVLARVDDVAPSQSAALVVLAAVIHLSTPAIVLIESRNVLFDQHAQVDDDEYFGPESEAPKESASRPALRPLRRPLFEASPHVHIWGALMDVVLPDASDHPFAFAFGPADLDMRTAVDDLRRAAPATFDEPSLRTILGTLGSAPASQRVIESAIRIARAPA